MKRLLLLIGIPFLIASCVKEDSEDVNQDKIYTDYEVYYNQNNDVTVAVAKFRFGGITGTTLELTGDAGVTYNGDTLVYNVFYGGHVKEYAGNVSVGNFIYTNVNGSSFANTAPTAGVIGFPTNFTTLDKNSAYDLMWTGDPLAQNEYTGIFIGSYTWGQDALILQASQGANNIVIGVNDMSNLAVGSSTCYMDRVKETVVAEGTSESGLIRARYRGINAGIQVTE